MIVDVRGPRLERSVTLRMQGDWGTANMSRVCGWLAQEFGDRCGPASRTAIWTGRGGADAIFAVGRGHVDLAVCTPARFARMALDATGPFAHEPFDDLRALAVIPQDDRLVVAVDATLGIRSFADCRRRRLPLRIAASPDDGINFVGLATHRVMAAAGIDDRVLRGWGGTYVEDERPFPCIDRYGAGDVDAVIHEAIMAPQWAQALTARPAQLLPIEDAVLDQLEAELGWARGVVAPGRLPGVTEPLVTLDFADFVILVRADLPHDVARLLTWCLVETRFELEGQYRKFPADNSPITWPLDPVAMADTPIPLHPGAAGCYADLLGEGVGPELGG